MPEADQKQAGFPRGREPIEVKPQKRSVWICACGLSRNFPYCDGSHRGMPPETGTSSSRANEAAHDRRDTA